MPIITMSGVDARSPLPRHVQVGTIEYLKKKKILSQDWRSNGSPCLCPLLSGGRERSACREQGGNRGTLCTGGCWISWVKFFSAKFSRVKCLNPLSVDLLAIFPYWNEKRAKRPPELLFDGILHLREPLVGLFLFWYWTRRASWNNTLKETMRRARLIWGSCLPSWSGSSLPETRQCARRGWMPPGRSWIFFSSF